MKNKTSSLKTPVDKSKTIQPKIRRSLFLLLCVLAFGIGCTVIAKVLRPAKAGRDQEASSVSRGTRKATVLRSDNSAKWDKGDTSPGHAAQIASAPLTELEINTAALPIIDVGAHPDGAAAGAHAFFNKKDKTDFDPTFDFQKIRPRTSLGEVYETSRSRGLPINERSVVLEGQVTNSQAYFSEDGNNIFTQYTIVPKIIHHCSSQAKKIGSSLIVTRLGGRVRYPSGKIVNNSVFPLGALEIGQSYLIFLSYPLDSEVSPAVGVKNNSRTFFFLNNAYLIGPDGRLSAVDRRYSSSTVKPTDADIKGQPLARLHGLSTAEFPAKLQQSLDRLNGMTDFHR